MQITNKQNNNGKNLFDNSQQYATLQDQKNNKKQDPA